MKKPTLLVMLGVVIGSWGCSFSAGTIATPTLPPVDEVGTVVAATLNSYTASPTEGLPTAGSPEVAATQPGGIPISYEGVSFALPGTLAGGATTENMTAVDSNTDAPWNVAPTHLRFTLTGYQLQGKFHEPRIFVYPADEYAQVNPIAAEQIENIKRILAGSPILKETLPRVPWFNAALLIAANIQIIPFQSGRGVRTLTEYAQYYAPINNRELFYHFEGLTDDHRYYIIAILPLTAPILPEDERPEASIPEGGVPIPTDIGLNNTYYSSVTQKLNSLSPDAFTPSLRVLDALIQSLVVANP